MPGSGRQLVLIETSGNQDYVFGSNRQRELLAASYLTWASTKRTLDHLPRFTEPDDRAGETTRILLTSGKAILAAPSAAAAQAIIFSTTATALRNAPGLDLRGVHADWPAEDTPEAAHQAVSRLFRLMEGTRGAHPGPASRLPGLPPQARCASTGLPAARFTRPGDNDPRAGDERVGRIPISQATAAKLVGVKKTRDELEDRFSALTLRHQKHLEESQTALEGADWIAVVHADGTGVGQIFLHFDRMVRTVNKAENKAATARDYFVRMGRFSDALDECGTAALKAAVKAISPTPKAGEDDEAASLAAARIAPVVPLVHGGDDLTALCLGRHALAFTAAYLRAFEERTAAHPDIRALAMAAQHDDPRLTACAGVAVVGARFPFHLAYTLATDLEGSAKGAVKPRMVNGRNERVPCSALDFHVHYDTSGGDLEEIRNHLVATDAEKAVLHGRPYIVKPDAESWAGVEARLSANARRWAVAHDLDVLLDASRLCTFAERDATEKAPKTIASAPLHLLRNRCFAGEKAAEATFRMLDQRGILPSFDPARDSEAERKRIDALLAPSGTRGLFFDDPPAEGEPTPRRVTRLLDAIDAARLQDPVQETAMGEARHG